MDFLLHNFIADMYGTQFLVFYGGIIVLTIMFCYSRKKRLDHSREMPPVLLTGHPDPYEIAFLRGGKAEVARLGIFKLLTRNILRPSETKRNNLEATPRHPDMRKLSSLEYGLITTGFTTPNTSDKAIRLLIKPEARFCEEFEIKAGNEFLIFTPERKKKNALIYRFAVLFILAFGMYKFSIAMYKGKTNVLFLLLMMIAGILILTLSGRLSHLTYRGRDYLKRLRESLESLKTQKADGASYGSEASLFMTFAVFGGAALVGNELYQQYNTYLGRPSASFSTDSSGGDSGFGNDSGGDSGGGDGGGGGGCGGCGGGGD